MALVFIFLIPITVLFFIMARWPDFFYGLTHNKQAFPMPQKRYRATRVMGIIGFIAFASLCVFMLVGILVLGL